MVGFRSMVDYARETLGCGFPSSQEPTSRSEFGQHAVYTAWTIMDLCGPPPRDQLFVMNCIALGVDQALLGREAPSIALMVMDLPPEIGMPLAVDIAHRVWPKSGEGPWLTTTEDGVPSDIGVVGADVPFTGKLARCTVTRGRGVLALFARGGTRIYMDVTEAPKEDIQRAIPEIVKLRKELGIKAAHLTKGAPRSMDEGKAIEAARLHRQGLSYVDIGRMFGWPIYDHGRLSCPQAEQYIRLGEKILQLLDSLSAAMEAPEAPP